jgi:GNAT superfamily N-acetyltransferase
MRRSEFALEIREPWQPEGPIIRRLLPGSAARPLDHRFRIAHSSEGQLVGAAAWMPGKAGAAGIRLHVLSDFRRCGIGTVLLQGIARPTGGPLMEAVASRLAEPGADAFLTSFGFSRAGSFTTAEVDLVTWSSNVSGLLRAPRLPSAVQLKSLQPCERQCIAGFYRRFIAPERPIHDTVLTRMLSSSLETVELILHRAEPVGFFAWTRNGERVTLDAWAAEAEFRHSRANAAILLSHCALWQKQGVKTVQFSWTDHADATARLARRFQAKVTAIEDRYQLRV